VSSAVYVMASRKHGTILFPGLLREEGPLSHLQPPERRF